MRQRDDHAGDEYSEREAEAGSSKGENDAPTVLLGRGRCAGDRWAEM
jgi:hypothetical protein